MPDYEVTLTWTTVVQADTEEKAVEEAEEEFMQTDPAFDSSAILVEGD